MLNTHPGSDLLGRTSECDELDRLLDDVRAARSRVLVLRGEAGVGKSALMNYVDVNAADEFIRQGLHARNDPRNVLADVHARYFGPRSPNAP